MRLNDGSRVTWGSKLSPHIWIDTNGQLICRDAIIARTGSYQYLESEVVENGDENKVVNVYRTDDEVFSPASIASFENKPFVNDHPDEDVTTYNCRDLQCGFIRNVKRGTGDLSNCLLCDIVVTDPDIIDMIKSGEKRELSLGYDTNIILKDGKYVMTNIRGNHLALVDSGRAGCATIRDSRAKLNDKVGGQRMKNLFRKSNRIHRMLDEDDIIEVEEIKDDEDMVIEEVVTEEAPVDAAETTAQTDEEPASEVSLGEIKDMLLQIMQHLKIGQPQTDEEPEEVKEKAEEELVEDDDDEVQPDSQESENFEDEEIEEEIADSDEDEDEEITDEDEVEPEETELLDADEDMDEPAPVKDAKSVYSKFSKVSDTRKSSRANSVDASWQKMYNKVGGRQ